MIPPPDPAVLREAAARALGEDRGPADITTLAVVPIGALAAGAIVAREACTLAGLCVAQAVFAEADAALKVEAHAQDGQEMAAGARVLTVSGPAAALLAAERSALNFLQQLSGVATLTRRFVRAVEGTKAKILDTRKTAPGLRLLQKYAVRCGGGCNHRLGLYDRFLIKDNHLALLGGAAKIAEAVSRARAFDPHVPLEVEADTLEQVHILAGLGVDVILLDNMPVDQLQESVRLIAGRAQTEASGGVTLDNVRAIAQTGVDFISVGALTHSASAVDFGLDFA